MKKRLLYLMLLTLYGCSTSSSISQKVASPVNSPMICPTAPTTSLTSQNVKPISLNAQTTKLSGTVNQNIQIGYTFTASTGQKLSYRTGDNLCIWVYAPNNELVTNADLPLDGQYTLQVAKPQGSGTFNLELSLGSEQISNFQSSNLPEIATSLSTPSQALSKSDFPRASCGDSKPTDPKEYPVNFYPVYIPYNESNLDYARLKFCRDAFKKIVEESNNVVIQLASFASKQKATSLAEVVSTEIKNSTVGKPTIVQWETN